MPSEHGGFPRVRALVLLLGLAVASAVALVHGNTWSSPFHFDDFHSIVDNAWLRSLRHVPTYFTDVAVFSPLVENRAYRPILLTGFAVSHALGGGAPWGYHLLTLLLHGAGGVVLGALLLRLLRAAEVPERRARVLALLGALLFVVHPLGTEAVTYVSARSSLQAAVLGWASVLCYVVAREDRRARWWWLGLLLLLLAMGTKIIAITVPAILLAWELLLGPSRRAPWAEGLRGWAVRLGPWVALVLLTTLVHERVVGEAARAGRSTIPPLHYLLTETEVWLRFLGLWVWPEDLCADLTMPWRTTWWSGPVARAILTNLALVAASLLVARRRPLITFGVLVYYVALSPTNSIMPLSEPASEHRVYVAMPGLVIACAGFALVLLERVGPRAERAALTLALVWVVALGVVAHRRNVVWQSDLTLWRDVVARSPDNGRAHLNYGLAQLSRGERRGARDSFDRCAKAWPEYAFCYINHAVLAIDEERYADAEANIAKAERLMPSNVYVRLWRGRVESARERWTSAEQAYRGTLGLAPGHLDARRGLAFALFMQGRTDEARPELLALEREGALDADTRYALGYLADIAGDAPRATALYRAALAAEPEHVRAAYNLAVALQRAGDRAGAIVLYEQLHGRGQAAPDALYNLAVALWQTDQLERARLIRTELAAVAPQHPGLAQLTY